MQLGILFMFHAHAVTCRGRIAQLRANNPGCSIFGLCVADHGLPPNFADWAPAAFDDLFVIPEGIPGIWKWGRSNILLALWHAHRGRLLDWDRLASVHWDQLIFGGIEDQFADLAPDQVYFSDLRLLDNELIVRWDWTHRFSFFCDEFQRFDDLVRRRFGYDEPLLASFCIFFIVPRRFLDALVELDDPDCGFQEYSVPTVARCLGFSFYERDLGVAWNSVESVVQKPMNCIGIEIEDAYIHAQLSDKRGWRFFHPYYRPWTDPHIPIDLAVDIPASDHPAAPSDLRTFLGVLRIPDERLEGLLDMFNKLCASGASPLELMDPDFYLGRHLGKGRWRQVGTALREAGKGALTTLRHPVKISERSKLFRGLQRKL